MHASTAFALLFALGAVAAPPNKHAHHHDKRQVVVTDVVYTVVTEAAQPGGAAPQGYAQPQQAPPAQPQPVEQPHYQNKGQQPAAPPPSSSTTLLTSATPPPPPPSPSPAAVNNLPAAPAPSPQAAAPPASGYDQQGNSAPTYGSQEYQQASVDSHNCHRSNHSVPALKWEQSLADAAKNWGSGCQFAHAGKDQGYPAANWPDGYGQNIAMGTDANDVAAVTSGMWYNGELGAFPEQAYNMANPPETSTDTGHLTQIIWKTTTSVGCFTKFCGEMAGGAYYTVCNYGPAGNVIDNYKGNIFPPGNAPTTNGT